jgi:transposase
MQPPLFVRPPTEEEQQALAAGLRSADAFTLRRCQIVLASARGDRVPAIARSLGCGQQTVRNALHAFARDGVAALVEGSSRPHTVQAAFDAKGAERLQALLHRSPRAFGHLTSVWTLELAAETAFTEGLTATRVSDETVRATLARLGIRWRRVKTWITSPDPAYAQKKRRRDRLTALAADRPDWAVGYADETWWSRVARPAWHAWSEKTPRLEQLAVPRDDPDPKALACYGLLVRPGTGASEDIWLRFVDDRPVSPLTTAFLAWCCAVGRDGQDDAGAGLGQRRLAHQSGGPPLAAGAQPAGPPRRRGAHHPLLLADQEPVAQPHRAAMGPRQAPYRRTRPVAHRPRTGGARLRRLRLSGRGSPSHPPGGCLIVH